MGTKFSFKKRIKLANGLYLNLSKGGISLSGSVDLFGIGKISLNASPKRGIKRTISLKGTGLSNSAVIVKPVKKPKN